ncbi:MAG: hypothetical protein WCM93_04420 [Bacteroidota bacterium]
MLKIVMSEINALAPIIRGSSANIFSINGSTEFSKLCDKRELLNVIRARMEEYELKYGRKETPIQVNIKSLVGHVNIISMPGEIDTTELEKQVTDALLKAIKAADQKS